MKHFRLLLLPVLWIALASPVAAEKISLQRLSDYLNGFRTAQADFTQVNGDGSVSTGRLFIKRPGRVRFEYDPPDKSLVLASGGTVAIFDPKSNQGPTEYPLKRTPLNLILARHVDLARAKMVIGHSADEKTTSVVAQDPQHPDYGTIRLVFADSPVELRQWVITDSAGGQTTVVLGALEKGKKFQPSLFSITMEAERRGSRIAER